MLVSGFSRWLEMAFIDDKTSSFSNRLNTKYADKNNRITEACTKYIVVILLEKCGFKIEIRAKLKISACMQEINVAENLKNSVWYLPIPTNNI